MYIWEKGRAASRVTVFAGSGRVQEEWPPHAIGKQSSMPLINLGHKHAIQIQA